MAMPVITNADAESAMIVKRFLILSPLILNHKRINGVGSLTAAKLKGNEYVETLGGESHCESGRALFSNCVVFSVALGGATNSSVFLFCAMRWLIPAWSGGQEGFDAVESDCFNPLRKTSSPSSRNMA